MRNHLGRLAEFIRGERRGNEIRSLMDNNDTRRRLDQITDAGLFERLATGVLRELDPRCRRLAETGVNAEGKTVQSPSDAIGYISGDGQLRMVTVHHTTCRRKDLRSKWLADLEKTRREFRKQKNRIPELRATMILTTNREPPEQLVHDFPATGQRPESLSKPTPDLISRITWTLTQEDSGSDRSTWAWRKHTCQWS